MEVTRRAVLAGMAAATVTGRHRRRWAFAATAGGEGGAAMPVITASAGIFNGTVIAAALASATGAARPATAGTNVSAAALIAAATGAGLDAPLNPLLPAAGTSWWGAYFGNPATTSAMTNWEASIAGRKMDLLYVYHDDTTTGPTAAEKTLCGAGSGRHLMWDHDMRNFSTGVRWLATDITAGTYDSYFNTVAASFASWGQPCWYTFQHEADNSSNRVMWQIGTNSGTNYTGSADFIAAWRHVHGIFVANGATKVQWVWDVTGDPAVNSIVGHLYPGNDVVDWIGWDPYTHSSWALPASLFSTFQTWLNTTGGPTYGIDVTKPQMIPETGVDNVAWTSPPQDYATWWRAVPAGAAACNLQAVVAFDRTGTWNTLIDGIPAEVTAYQAPGADPRFNQP